VVEKSDGGFLDSSLKEVSVASDLTVASVSVSGGAHVHAQRARCYGTCEKWESAKRVFNLVESHSRVLLITYSLTPFPRLL
jgi:hypothetical protein